MSDERVIELRVTRPPEGPPTITEIEVDQQQRAEHRSAVHRQMERKTGRPSGDPMPADEARKLTDRIKRDVEQLSLLIQDAYLGRADIALGYQSWDDYCAAEFDTGRLRIPREERREVVSSLRDAGLSDRAIESATGISRSTLIRDKRRRSGGVIDTTSASESADDDALAEQLIAAEPADVVDAEIAELAPVIGIDGKTYRQPQRQKPQPKQFTFPARFYSVLSQMQHHALRLQMLTKEQGFAGNLDELCRQHRDGVTWVHEIITGVLDQMHTEQDELFGGDA